ncbi:N-acetylmannosamine-6-phosphate 2-epimerase [Trichothermofontia sichuanensis B231]|uniref:N-acetylmannosamine-6-phosphate 2-epimerase n=1 Tax=Trichothermofontia sichuanensis TaxID=3045816 RepID=UPI002247DEFA|nr:N-acetylmannosamine-6-phosphate 2-epimerase [Trichothermofontia sichuanensis]UZQ54123.1 N-acetylmannosamine-6-phosphate 2-epimerase [Trichothermofontia sichuanensis B231]
MSDLLPSSTARLPHGALAAALHHGLIVSCQAPVDSPLHDARVIAAMAQAAVRQGAVGVRIDTPEHVRQVRWRLPEIPIIGLWKQSLPGFDVYITPQFHHAQAIAAAGADIIAIDATLRPRPNGETVRSLTTHIHEQLGKLVMADVDSLAAAVAAVEAGVDLVGTTLYGYTAQTQDQTPPGFDLLRVLVQTLSIPVICEGGISTPAQAQQAFALGATAIVVGTAITGIEPLTQAYVRACPR